GAAAAQAREVVGRELQHRVVAGDTLRSLAARYAVEPATLARINGLSRREALPIGEELRVVSHHVVPRTLDEGIVVNVPQRMLFLFRDGRLAGHFPVGIGRRGWTTPPGRYRIAEREEDPSWEVPRSIQAEMRRKGQRVVKSMPPGPDNPLGRHWLGLNRNGIGIHGTPQTSSLFGFVSHGCVRMHPEDIETLFEQVEVGTPVEIVYEPVLLARDEEGGIVLEVHPDAYRRVKDPLAVVTRQAEALGVADLLDWTAVRGALRERAGIAVAVDGTGSALAAAE
ncbi:MAG TPA: L,D-transpeptidase family protein, partial [Vicinamibacteria bacterium]|nr:L,D-transpeptidase family protein [Vicinamibacteria bacterium]